MIRNKLRLDDVKYEEYVRELKLASPLEIVSLENDWLPVPSGEVNNDAT